MIAVPPRAMMALWQRRLTFASNKRDEDDFTPHGQTSRIPTIF